MLFVKNIQKFLASVVLLTTLMSFSGFNYIAESVQIAQTEVLTHGHTYDYSKIKVYQSPKKILKKITYNQYTLFSFKSLLRTYNFGFNIHFKTQKETALQFIKFNTILEQNLIASTLSKNTPSFLTN